MAIGDKISVCACAHEKIATPAPQRLQRAAWDYEKYISHVFHTNKQ
jgi:hypothetical protein